MAFPDPGMAFAGVGLAFLHLISFPIPDILMNPMRSTAPPIIGDALGGLACHALDAGSRSACLSKAGRFPEFPPVEGASG